MKHTDEPNTLAAFLGRCAGSGYKPTEQQIFDAGVKSGMQRTFVKAPEGFAKVGAFRRQPSNISTRDTADLPEPVIDGGAEVVTPTLPDTPPVEEPKKNQLLMLALSGNLSEEVRLEIFKVALSNNVQLTGSEIHALKLVELKRLQCEVEGLRLENSIHREFDKDYHPIDIGAHSTDAKSKAPQGNSVVCWHLKKGLKMNTDYWECTLGSKSHINLFGKIVLFPFIVFFRNLIYTYGFSLHKKTEIILHI